MNEVQFYRAVPDGDYAGRWSILDPEGRVVDSMSGLTEHAAKATSAALWRARKQGLESAAPVMDDALAESRKALDREQAMARMASEALASVGVLLTFRVERTGETRAVVDLDGDRWQRREPPDARMTFRNLDEIKAALQMLRRGLDRHTRDGLADSIAGIEDAIDRCDRTDAPAQPATPEWAPPSHLDFKALTAAMHDLTAAVREHTEPVINRMEVHEIDPEELAKLLREGGPKVSEPEPEDFF